MSSPYYQKGNTVKLEVEFYDWDDNLVDPERVQLKILDAQYNVIKTITPEQIGRIDVGKYQYYYITDTEGVLYYEWLGYIDNRPSLKRRSIVVKKV